MILYNTSNSATNTSATNTSATSNTAKDISSAGNKEYSLKEGEVILEVRLGLGKKAKNSPNSIATLRGTDPVGGFYRNSHSGEVFVKVALASMRYNKGKLAIGEDGLPQTGLINGVLRVTKQLSPIAQELAKYLADGAGGLFPVNPMSTQAEAVCQTKELQAALQELRVGAETRKAINTRQSWEDFSMKFFGEKYVKFFMNPENAEQWAEELEEIGSREDLKNHSLVIGYRLTKEGQPCWREGKLAPVGKRKGNKITDTLIEGTDEYLKELEVNMEVAYMHLHQVKNRVVDPSKTMNKEYFVHQLSAFLSMQDTSSEGIGREVIEARQSKWASIKATLRGEAGGKKKVIARKAYMRSLAEEGTSEAVEELKQIFQEVNAIVKEGASNHWKAGGVDELLKEVNSLLGYDLLNGEASPSKVEDDKVKASVEPDEVEEEEEEEEVLVPLSPDDLEDETEEAAPEAIMASGKNAARLLMMRKAK